MRFEWDDLKNHANFKSHDVWFEKALTVWNDGSSEEYFDADHSLHEDRYVRIGYSMFDRLLVVVSCERDHGMTVRIISARKASTRERKQHEEGI